MACRAVARQSEGWSQSRVLPSAKLAYETGLSAGSIALLALGHHTEQSTSRTMLWRLWKWSARDEWASQAFQEGCPKWASSLSRAGMHVQGCLILSQVGLLFPVNHAPMKLASLIRLRSEATADGSGFDLSREVESTDFRLQPRNAGSRKRDQSHS